MLTSIKAKPPLVLLHGWGLDRSVFHPWQRELGRYFQVRYADLPGYGDTAAQIDPWCAELAAELPQPVVLLGWSLGGQAAVRFAYRYPGKVKALINVAGNPSFVQRDDWHSAMPERVFNEFAAGFTDSPQQTLRRFTSLAARGKNDARLLQKSLQPGSTGVTAQQRGLTLLRGWDVRSELLQLQVPVLHLLGAQDRLVPPTLVAALRRMAPWQQVRSVSGAGHAVFLSEGADLAAQVYRFAVQREGDAAKPAKQRVADSFSRAATSYDAVAHLQRRIGDRLMGTLQCTSPAVILDLGCGTGSALPGLHDRFPAASLVAADIAWGMLARAGELHDSNEYYLLLADAEGLPLDDESVDCIHSNLALQWCDLRLVLRECWRVLKPGGKLYFSTLGPKTLTELRTAWRQVDNLVHVNRFTARAEVDLAAAQAGLRDCRVTREIITLQYRDLRDLTSELKALGAHNVNNGARSGMTGKSRLRALLAAYEQYRDADGMLPASYEALYISARKAHG